MYTFAFGLLSISLSAYNYVLSELPLPDIRSVYRHMNELLIIKPYMLINLSYLPEILDQYKNITINENVSSVSYTKSIIYCQLFLFIYCLIIQARQTIILLQKLKKSQIFVKKWNKYYRYGQRWRLHFINI